VISGLLRDPADPLRPPSGVSKMRLGLFSLGGKGGGASSEGVEGLDEVSKLVTRAISEATKVGGVGVTGCGVSVPVTDEEEAPCCREFLREFFFPRILRRPSLLR